MKIRYRCDYPMATKKGIRRHCDKKCGQCICAIATDEWGMESHVPDLAQPCSNVTLRNLKVMMGREHDKSTGKTTR